MKTVQANCRVHLKFSDEDEATYVVRNPLSFGLDMTTISTASPLGKAILGKEEGSEIILKDIQGATICCRIVKIYDPAYNAP